MPASMVLAPQSDVGTRSLHEMLWNPGEKWICKRGVAKGNGDLLSRLQAERLGGEPGVGPNRSCDRRLTPTDLRAVTPLIWEHVNPYGRFDLDMETRLDLSPNGPW
jgi:hypothetical protein